MTGTLINAAAVIVGGTLGLLLGGRLPDKLRRTVISAMGLFTIAWGVQMFLNTKNPLYVLGGLLIGVIIGELTRIEDGLQRLGSALERRFMPSGNEPGSESRFVRGFLTGVLVFCVGPMAILGSIQDGLSGDYQVLVVKSVLDGFSALAFASSLGLGVLFSAAVILIYQGGISLAAAQVNALVTPDMMAEMTAAGGVILMGIAISSLLEIKKIRVGSFLPALLAAPLIVWIVSLFK